MRSVKKNKMRFKDSICDRNTKEARNPEQFKHTRRKTNLNLFCVYYYI